MIKQTPFRAALLAVLFVTPGLALAQQSPGYFIPPAAGGGGGPAPRSAPAPRAAPRPAPPLVQPNAPAQAEAEQAPPSAPVTLPPVADLQPLPRASSPPAAVIGVLGIPDIMRASAAAQQIEKVIGERREKLNVDAQKEQAAWRDMQQGLANERAKMSADQIRTKERELQERITNAQKQFRDRNRIIQESGQYGLAQIERMLIAVIRQVAESRGMNLVLHRAQVALNVNEFDITEQVVEQLNKTLPTVVLPPDGVAASSFVPPGATPVAGQAGASGQPGAAAPAGGGALPVPPAPVPPPPPKR